MSRINEKRHISRHETCTCKFRLDVSICNDKQCWNNDKCRRECKKLIDEGSCADGFVWNPSISECECGKLCDVGESLIMKIVNEEKG